MAYQIDKFNKEFLTSVEDGTIDQTTDLTFIGKNYAGYGEFHNENFLFLLENFASATGPTKPITGQIWFDTATSKLKFYDGAKWRTTGGAEVTTSQPAGLATGDLWWDSSNDQLYVFNGSNYILIGPQDAGDGITQLVSQIVVDQGDNNRSVIVSYVNDIPVYVISPEEFAIKDIEGNRLDGFTIIRRGLTLRDTENDEGETTSTFRFYGTATNAVSLEGFKASDFVKTTDTSFNTAIDFTDGITVGNVFKMEVDSSGITSPRGILINTSGASNEIHFKTLDSSSVETHSITINSTGLLPADNNTFD